MNKNNLKQVLRPLIKECIKEVIFEEGFLSGLVTEVLVGVQAARPEPIIEQKSTAPVVRPPPAPDRTALRRQEQERNQKMRRTRQQMSEAIGRDAYNGVNLFEGTAPITKGGTPGTTAEASGPLAGVDPNDPGVDISAFFGGSANRSK